MAAVSTRRELASRRPVVGPRRPIARRSGCESRSGVWVATPGSIAMLRRTLRRIALSRLDS